MDPGIHDISEIRRSSLPAPASSSFISGQTSPGIGFRTPQTHLKEQKRKGKTESILKWFDRTVENELGKRREGTYALASNIPRVSGMQNTLVSEASTSAIDIHSMMRGDQNTDLYEAVDKLAKAQAMDQFEGAVKAAERAASEAPPEYAEEAAAAGARGFQAELTSIIQETVPGARPVEVIGYVGITRPKLPKRT